MRVITHRYAVTLPALPVSGIEMLRWTTLIGALMLVLMLWTGGAAHAAERFDCIPVTLQAEGHFDGDGDEAPAGPDQGVAHHHAGCSGHHLSSPDSVISTIVATPTSVLLPARSDSGTRGNEPDGELRPPIA